MKLWITVIGVIGSLVSILVFVSGKPSIKDFLDLLPRSSSTVSGTPTVAEPSEEKATLATDAVVPDVTPVSSPKFQYVNLPLSAVSASLIVRPAHNREEYVQVNFLSVDRQSGRTNVENLPIHLADQWVVESDLCVLIGYEDGQLAWYPSDKHIFFSTKELTTYDLRDVGLPAAINKPSLQIINFPRKGRCAASIRIHEPNKTHELGLTANWSPLVQATKVIELPPEVLKEAIGVGDLLVRLTKDSGEVLMYANNSPIPLSSSRVSVFDLSSVRPIIERN